MIWVAIALIATLIGFFMPEFYNWTGADQSRPAPVVPWIAGGLLALNIILDGVFLWTYFRGRAKSIDERPGSQWTIRQLLILMGLVAGLLVIGSTIGPLTSSLILLAEVVIFGIATCIRLPNSRVSIPAMVVAFYAPYLWLLRGATLSQLNDFQLGVLVGLPGFVPSALFASFLRRPHESMAWFAVLVTAVALLIGIGLLREGKRRGLAYAMWLATFSIFGSFVLHSLARA